MNADEIRGLIDTCSAAYRQDSNPRDEMIWTAALGDLPFGLARQAVVEWIRTSPWWPKPADLRERARLIAAQHDRERDKRQQIAGRNADVQADIRAHSARQRTGANMVRHVLGRLKDAGSDPEHGKYLGAERCADVAEEAVAEWLTRTTDEDS